MTAALTPAYAALLDELGRTRYATRTVREHYLEHAGVADPERVTCVVRVDVDHGLHLAPRLAEAMASRGIRASHYLLSFSRYYELWGSGVPAAIRGVGHEVGLHMDHLFAALVEGGDAPSRLRADLLRLGEELGEPVAGATFHGHPEIDALGRSNWELTREVEPHALGLQYHDGWTSCYAVPGLASWQPPCDLALSDYLGFPLARGFNYVPGYAPAALRAARSGEVVHLVVHTLNAFRYWESWSSSCGEQEPARESRWVFATRATRLRARLALGEVTPLRRQVFQLAIDATARALTLGGRPARSAPNVIPLASWGVTSAGTTLLDLSRRVGADQAERLGIALMQLDPERLDAGAVPPPDGSVATVLASDEGLGPDPFELLARFLAPGGRGVLIAPTWRSCALELGEGLSERDATRVAAGVAGLVGGTLQRSVGRRAPLPHVVPAGTRAGRAAAHGLQVLRRLPWTGGPEAWLVGRGGSA